MIYAVGDIHGQYAMLQELLDKLLALPFHDEDTLIFLGDYVDRGEETRRVIEILLAWRDCHPNTIFLRGNHEQFLLDARDGPAKRAAAPDPALRAERMLTWLQNGGSETLFSYDVPDFQRWHDSLNNLLIRIPAEPLAYFKANFLRWLDAIPPAHWDFVRRTEIDYVTERYHFVHAGLLDPGATWESEGWSIDPRLWIREPFLESRADFNGRIVVFGHTPQKKGRPLVRPNKIGIDTGAVFGGPLTAVVLAPPQNGEEVPPRFLQVPHRRTTLPLAAVSPQSADPSKRASSARSSRK